MTRTLAHAVALMAIGSALAALILAGAQLGAAGQSPAEYGATLRVFAAIACIAGALYLVAVAIVLRSAVPRATLWGIFLIAALMRVAAFTSAPFLSTDVYRYVWDGRVQAEGVNPYRYVPNAPELGKLRDSDVYARINRVDYARTIYPPVAEAIYFLVGQVHSSVFAMRAAMVGFEILAVLAMLALLDMAGLPRERILIYAWNPLAAWEFACNGHIDAAEIALIALALLADARGRKLLTGALLGAAVLTKFFPAALFPALWRRWDVRMPAACVAVIAAFYLVYIDVGWKVLGFLPTYVSEEGLRSGSGFFYAAALKALAPSFPAAVYPAIALVALGAVAYWAAFVRERLPSAGAGIVATARAMLVLATALMLAVTPHYAWYFTWLALPACLAPFYSVLYLTAAAPLLYLDPTHSGLLWSGLVYGVFPILAALEFWWRRRERAEARIGSRWRTSS
jgi:hypothetical protein